MRDQFHILLPSNSSMKYYPENTTTRFVTQLPQQIQLQGTWSVALTEIQIPLTFQHLPLENDTERTVTMNTTPVSSLSTNELRTLTKPNSSESLIHPGVYDNLQSLVKEVNDLSCVQGHLKFVIERGNFIAINRICTACPGVNHSIEMSKRLCKIFGFQSSDDDSRAILIGINVPVIGNVPAHLSNSLPNILMVYCDLCEPYLTGDVQTKLLRALSINIESYSYGSIMSKSFSPPMYLPLLFNSFHSIEIDIRDPLGKPIPFDFGTATVVLHFKQTE